MNKSWIDILVRDVKKSVIFPFFTKECLRINTYRNISIHENNIWVSMHYNVVKEILDTFYGFDASGNVSRLSTKLDYLSIGEVRYEKYINKFLNYIP